MARTIDNYRTLIVADELEEGHRILGKISGEEYRVILVQKGADDILGTAVWVTVQAEDAPPVEYSFREFDKIWILS